MKSEFVPGRQREDEDLCYETVLENEQKQLASVGTIGSGILKLTIDCLDGGGTYTCSTVKWEDQQGPSGFCHPGNSANLFEPNTALGDRKNEREA